MKPYPAYHPTYEYGLIPESLRYWVRTDSGSVLEGCGDCGVIAYAPLVTHRLPNGATINLCEDCTKEQQAYHVRQTS